MASMSGEIARKWREIQGEHKWKGLLDPLDIDLRRSLLVYGNLVQAVEDGFEKDITAQHYGDCRYKKDPFFQRVYLENGNPYKYQVTKYIYATSILTNGYKDSNWIGYVAVATEEGKTELGRRDVVVVWRGSITEGDWREDFDFSMDKASEFVPGINGHVHRGFLSVYVTPDCGSPYDKTSARDQVLGEVRKLVSKYKDEDLSITVAGFSLGAALTTLTSIDIVANGYNRPGGSLSGPLDNLKEFLVTAVGFGCPRVGDADFTNQYDNMKNLSFLKVKNDKDIVPTFPATFPHFPYSDCGVELPLDTTQSPDLKDNAPPHNLEIYLHGVAGTDGKDGKFNRVIDRPLALVNKDLDALVDDKIPARWWAESKGMVQGTDGSWNPKNKVEPTAESST